MACEAKLFVRADPLDENCPKAWEEWRLIFWSWMTMIAVIFLAINIVI